MGKARQCGNKRRHDSDCAARVALIKHHGDNPQYNVYLCPHCHFWHVGHKIVGEDHSCPNH